MIARILAACGSTVLALGLQPIVLGVMIRWLDLWRYFERPEVARVAWVLCTGGALIGWLCAFRKRLNLGLVSLSLLMLGWLVGLAGFCTAGHWLHLWLEEAQARRYVPTIEVNMSAPWIALAALLLVSAWLVRRAPAVRSKGIPCLKCGYDLTGLREARCPECGSQYTLDQLR
jgi:hypothetical protein